MNRNYYCKVNSQKEADELLKKLRDIGENIDRYIYTDTWQYIVYDKNTSWALSDIKTSKEEFEGKIEVPSSELIDYVTGKKLDKDALLEEAKRRYPVGTKINSSFQYNYKTTVHGYNFEEGNIHCVDQLGRNNGYIYYSGKWAETVEEPKVETKFEKGKWYELKYNFKDKLCNIIGKSIESSTNILYFNKYYNIIKGKWSEADFLSLDKDISLIYSKELSLQEIQQYLPDGHPDKIKQEVKEEVKSREEWSVGSYVVFLKDYGGHHKGTIDTIRSTTSEYITVENCSFNGSKITCNLYRDSECKWFPTLQEAQKFSNELLGKSKTDLKVEDLVEGEIYYTEWEKGDNQHIFKYLGGSLDGCRNYCIVNGRFTNTERTFTHPIYKNNIRLATPQERKWLKTCIKQDKFIPKEDLDKYDSYLKNIYSGKTRKSPELMDRTKIKVEIKRTKAKQIKL